MVVAFVICITETYLDSCQLFCENNYLKRGSSFGNDDLNDNYEEGEAATRAVLKKRCSENTQQIYRRTPMPKCDFNKVALQLY